MIAPERIKELVRTFDYNLEAYKRGSYNETQVRREFIDPFFEELGWDIANKKGYAAAYKDVIHEDAIKVGGVTKAPDYCFRIGGARKFFLEAKKPSVNIQEDVHPAYQLRRYGWSAKLPLSILTDFEEFAVYNCRMKPARTDKVSHSRILYLRYMDYVDRWEEIAGIFSRDAILKGSFDKYIESSKIKKGTTEVDASFLQEIERWRELLARNIALRNPNLTQRELNYSVQQTIDRIVFLRICEDRGMEDYGGLMALQNGDNIYKRLFQLFNKADEKYNSGLFHFKKEKDRENYDNLTPSLQIDDKPLKDIFKNLYYPESPYEFSVLSADILGQVYEKFLGKVIRLTAGHQARIEEKPEVRKAGGVYYTPDYIVDYIVKNTVGKLVEGKKPGPRGGVSNLKILDPACGSGSFLIGAYQFLLDWHRNEYIKDGPDNWSKGKTPRIYQSGRGEWRLTIDERKRILLNNIYGVDIDHQAVEVTKLSLLLKALEGEDEQSIGKQMALFQKRVLPDLSNNIKCGNSLIGPDFYEHQQMSFLDEEEIFRVNAFYWNTEFAEIMNNGGFDAVIGNPPYVRQEGLGYLKNYFEKHYSVYHGVADLYVYFIEKGVSLLKQGGFFSYIVANKWFRANYGKSLRQWMKRQNIFEIIDFGDLPVFKQASTYPCIVVIQKKAPVQVFRAVTMKTLEFGDLKDYIKQHSHEVRQDNLDESGWSLANQGTSDLLDKLRKRGIPLGEYVGGKIFYGIKTGLNDAFVIDDATREQLIAEDPKSGEVIKPFLAGRNIKRYQPLSSEKYVLFTRRGIDIDKYPAIKNYLTKFKENLLPRPKDWKGEKWLGRKPGSYQWYEIQDTIDYYQEFEKPKIIVPAIVKSASYAYDAKGFYSNDKTTIIPTKDKYLLGLIGSTTLDFYIHSISATKQGGYFEYKPMYISKLPIRTINFNDPTEVALHDQMVSLVDKMLDLHKRLTKSRVPHTTETLKRQLELTDRQIDQLVYRLYDLTDEEIKIVESGS
ncbi:MAG TPA: TaqI-like C-terminal specificity domain-containing protein [Desulfobacteraceae bacterium]|nr:TaqI-like C-terminal specificity domain-containing protein [Desulfobacteraceae bacterium]HPJ66488.1 TaqI-like C-terminal specificity domain-containing protein [Desulfobacteraceae bacterium]HPQ28224.1 TaqI-like C-terminal specificity domain-containing protein [Desulfobacteraceae bacterium]